MAGVRRERKHTYPGSGPGRVPDTILFCCHCRAPTPKGEMTAETNPESPVYGMLSCRRKGCLESPKDKGYLDYSNLELDDTIGPAPGNIAGITYNT